MPLPDHPNLTVQQAVALEDFFAYLPQHTYIFTPTREMWPASSVQFADPACHGTDAPQSNHAGVLAG